MRLALAITCVLLFTSALYCAADWDGTYEGGTLPSPPLDLSEVTNPAGPGDIIDIGGGNFALQINDVIGTRARYGINYGAGIEAGTIETTQRFVSSSCLENIGLMMRQDTPGASAETRVAYYDDGSGHAGLWDYWAEPSRKFLGPIDTSRYYRLRMVLDGAAGGRLYVDDSFFAILTPAPGNTSRSTFGAGSTDGSGEVYIDYFRWKQGVKAGPGEPGDPSIETPLSPRVVTLPSALPGLNSALITWTTDVPTDSTVHWGTSWSCLNSSYDASAVTNHSVNIAELQQGTTYYFYVESRIPPSGIDIARPGIQPFTTQDTFRIDVGPFVRTWISSGGTSATSTMSWNTTAPADSKLFYRLKNGSWTEIDNSELSVSNAIAVSGLSVMSTYEYYVTSTDSALQTVQSPVAEFFTYVYSQVGSILTDTENAGFELGGIGPFTPGWTVYATGDPGAVHYGLWRNAIVPHSGDYFLGADSEGGSRSGVIYQSVTGLTSGENVNASAWVYTCEKGTSGAEEHNSAFCQVGVDVTQDPGAIDPNAASIRWSAPMYKSNSGPWTCVGAAVPRNGSSSATIFLRNVQTADGGLNITCFDDAVLTTTPPVTITSPAVTALVPTAATIEWTTDVAANTFVQFGQGTLASYGFTDHYLNEAKGTTHSATIRLLPNTTYVFQAGSASGTGLGLSEPIEIATPMNETLENAGFEDTDNYGKPTAAPWTIFQYNPGDIGRFGDPVQPAGGPIDGLVGPYPFAGATWHGITCESAGGSHFIGAFAATGSNKNGGGYQRVKVTPGQPYRAAMRILTGQDPIDLTHPASNTACAVAIDPTGGTNILSLSLVWSADKPSTTNGQWDALSVKATAESDIITVFCIIEQRYLDSTHLSALDNVTLEYVPPFSGPLGSVKKQAIGDTIAIENAVVTYCATGSRLYIEEANRSSGIAVIPTEWTDPPAPGDKITGVGVLDVIDQEAVIKNAVITRTPGSPSDVPKPLSITQRSSGGEQFGVQPGVINGAGLSSVGLLVTVVGKVTNGDLASAWQSDGIGHVYAYLDDGSKLGGISLSGMRIVANESQPNRPNIAYGDFISATGVLSIEGPTQELRPVLLIGDVTTVRVIQPR